MREIVFYKSPFDYQTQIKTSEEKPNIDIFLDTGSPVTLVSIPTLIQMTGELFSSFCMSVEKFLNQNQPITMGAYGMSDDDNRFAFIPYIVNEVVIGDALFKPFMFWVNVTGYKSKNIKNSSTLFGMDYINQGKKWFDENDDFHIQFEGQLRCDTREIGAALKQRGKIQKLDFVDINVRNISQINEEGDLGNHLGN